MSSSPAVSVDRPIRVVCASSLWPLFLVATAFPQAGGRAENAAPVNTLRVASVSVFPVKWDKNANADKMERLIRQAAASGSRLLILPEGVLEGYVVNEVIREKDPQRRDALIARFHKIAEPIDGPYFTRFRKLADELNVFLIFGFLEDDHGRLWNSAALIGPDGKLIGRYHKTHLHQGYTVNPPGYEPGNAYPVFEIDTTQADGAPAGGAGGSNTVRLGMMICFDRQLPEPARILAIRGAQIIACPTYGGRGDWNTRLMQVRAYENQVHVIFTHPEQSLIIDRDGELVREGTKDSFVVYDLDLAKPKKTREAISRRRPSTYGAMIESEQRGAESEHRGAK